LIVGWCGRFLFFVVPRQFSPDIGEWPENQILISDWTYFHCPGATLAFYCKNSGRGVRFQVKKFEISGTCHSYMQVLSPTQGWCQMREKIDWQELHKFDCWLEQTIFIFCCPLSIFTRDWQVARKSNFDS